MQTVFELKTPSTFTPRTPESGYTLFSPLLFALIGGTACGAGFFLSRVFHILENIYVQTSGSTPYRFQVDGYALFVHLAVPSVGVPIMVVTAIALWAALAYLVLRCFHSASCRLAEILRICIYTFAGRASGFAFFLPFLVLSLALMGLVLGAPQMGGSGFFHSNAALFHFLISWMLFSVRPVSRILQAVHGVRCRDAWLAALLPGFFLNLLAFPFFIFWR